MKPISGRTGLVERTAAQEMPRSTLALLLWTAMEGPGAGIGASGSGACGAAHSGSFLREGDDDLGLNGIPGVSWGFLDPDDVVNCTTSPRMAD